MKTFSKIALVFFILCYTTTVFSQARVQLVHNSPDAAGAVVDIYVNDQLLDGGDDVTYKSATPFFDVPAGVDLKFDIAPGTSMSSAESVYDATVNLMAGTTHVIIAEGILSGSGYNPTATQDMDKFAFGLKIFDMGLEVGANGDTNTDLLIHHGVTDAPAVDIVNVTDGANEVLVAGIAYSEFVGYASIPVDDYSVEVRAAGATDAVASYIAPLETLSLGGAAITVLASGFLDPTMNSDGEPFGLFAVTAAGDFIPLPSNDLSVNAFNESGVAIFPNPTASQLNVTIPFVFNTANVTAYDVTGRQVLSTSIASGNTARVDMSALTNGMYIFQLDVNNRILTTKVQVVQK